MLQNLILSGCGENIRQRFVTSNLYTEFAYYEAARQLVLQSHSGDLIARGIRRATPILPDDVREWLGKYIDELDQKLHAPPVEGSQNPSGSGVAGKPSEAGNGRGAPPAKPTETDRRIQEAEQQLKKVFESSK